MLAALRPCSSDTGETMTIGARAVEIEGLAGPRGAAPGAAHQVVRIAHPPGAVLLGGAEFHAGVLGARQQLGRRGHEAGVVEAEGQLPDVRRIRAEGQELFGDLFGDVRIAAARPLGDFAIDLDLGLGRPRLLGDPQDDFGVAHATGVVQRFLDGAGRFRRQRGRRLPLGRRGLVPLALVGAGQLVQPQGQHDVVGDAARAGHFLAEAPGQGALLAGELLVRFAQQRLHAGQVLFGLQAGGAFLFEARIHQFVLLRELAQPVRLGGRAQRCGVGGGGGVRKCGAGRHDLQVMKVQRAWQASSRWRRTHASR
ncbi:hypothetical protein [Achromobacter denitrificans]|uniref:hypothetical protein n=1 Tax=Achromobacter denitrificans TaxID=32002 RepID=UPI001E32844D|nr:hypothetical protein [Achromobacter denitrificans]